MRGRIRVKVTEDHSGFFGVRTVKQCTGEDEALIMGRREHMKKRRREHRKREATNS